MASYMLLFWAPKHVLTQPRSNEQAAASGAKWHAWDKALRDAGHSVTGAQLESGGRCVSGAGLAVSEGPFAGDHVMGGWFIVSAASLDEATDLAKGCPVLANGGTVEVRPVQID